MAFDSFTTYRSPFSRIGNSFTGMLLSPVFIIGAAALLFYTEKNAVRTADSLTAGAKEVVEASAAEVDPSRTGKLLHVTGDAKPEGDLTDPDFGVTAQGIRLTRTVEIYQWTETSHTSNNQTRYDYETKWKEGLTKSGSFKQPNGHQNPAQVAYPSKDFQAESVSVGAYQLDPSLVKKIGDPSALSLKEDSLTLPEGARLEPGGTIYVGKNPNNPAVGDLRITEKLTAAGPVSVVAAQQGNKLTTYASKNGGEIALLERGTQTSEHMFQNAQSANVVLTWVLRVVGFIVLFIGIHAIFGPLSSLASFVPILGAVFEGGVLIISFLLTVVGWFVLVGIAWVTARPFLAIPLLIIAVLAVVSLFWLLLKRHTARKARLAGGTPPIPA